MYPFDTVKTYAQAEGGKNGRLVAQVIRKEGKKLLLLVEFPVRFHPCWQGFYACGEAYLRCSQLPSRHTLHTFLSMR